ncbi:MAG: glycosyltransferase [Deltaproteobacteria bacterium]|nr:glycosyltransferase [Deltaproteobacteria bacterium]
MDELAPARKKWLAKNKYYYDQMLEFLRWHIPQGCSVLEVGCGTGHILAGVKPSRGVGIDVSPRMVEIAQADHPELEFRVMDAHQLDLGETFDYIIVSDTLVYLEDIELFLKKLKKVTTPKTRIIFTFHNSIWIPLIQLAEKLKLKMPQVRLNMLGKRDVTNLLTLEDYQVVTTGRRFLFPADLPGIAPLCNRYLAPLPLINHLCLMGFIIARVPDLHRADNQDYSVTVVVPARNEKGNIAAAVTRTPVMGSRTEILFVEGNSTDDTLAEIQRVCAEMESPHELRWAVQDGKGKGDAVRKGYGLATGDILMILDADLTMPPEDLPKFYNAIASGKGEYINGSRLIYPMEKQAMRFLNMVGNKFFSLMFSFLLNQRITDTLCGTKVLFKEDYERLAANRAYFGDFDPFGDFDLIFGATKLDLKFLEVPIRYRARTYGSTNISRFSHGWLLIKMVAFAMKRLKFV